MRVVVAESASVAALAAADLVEQFITCQPSPALGLATGETMVPVYLELVRRHREVGLSFCHVRAYLLDEYLDLDGDDPRAFRNVVQRLLAGRTDLEPGAVHGPDADARDLVAECVRYEQQVREASIGLQLLGIGTNGHIAFNEPGSPLHSTTRVVTLSERTRADNAHSFPAVQRMPTRAISQGLATIGAAARLVLVAFGEHKALAVASAIEGRVSSEIPASVIQMHPDATVVLDSPAASALADIRKRDKPSYLLSRLAG